MADPLLDFASIDSLLKHAQAEPAPRDEAMGAGMPRVDTTGPGFGMALPGMADPETKPAAPMFQAPYAPAPAPAGNAKDALGVFTKAIAQVETKGIKDPYTAKNPVTSASGKYQYINSTWGGYGGYAQARHAPPSVQEAKFREDALNKLKKFNGDPYRMLADHMLPAQANKPWLWTQPTYHKQRKNGKTIIITAPPVADYIRKAVKGSAWEGQFDQYLKAQGAMR